MKLYIVHTTDCVIGVYTNHLVARQVALIYGFGSIVSTAELNHVVPGVIKEAAHYGINLNDVDYIHEPEVEEVEEGPLEGEGDPGRAEESEGQPNSVISVIKTQRSRLESWLLWRRHS